MADTLKHARMSLLAGIACAALLAWPASASMERARQAQARGDLRAAQIELRNAVRAAPNDAAARAALAEASLDLADFDTAEKEARAALERGYDRAEGTATLLRAYLGLRRYDELLRDFPAIAEPAALGGQVAAGRALAQLANRRADEARASAAEAVRLAPGAPQSHLAMAAVELAARDLVAADAAVDRALAADPRSVDALLRKAQFQFGRGELEPAAATLAAVTGLRPGQVLARTLRAEALMRLGRDAEARQEIDAALRTAPGAAPALFVRAMLEARAEDWRAVDATLQQIGAPVGNYPGGLLLVALAKRALGQPAQAEDAARRYVARQPEDPRGVRLLAALELAAGRNADAMATLQNSVRRGSADAAVLDMLGRLEAAAGQPRAAADALARAAALAPTNADVLARLAAARLASGDVVGAAEAAEGSLRLTPEQGGARAMLAVSALMSGDVAAAEAEREQMSPEARATPGGRLLEGTLQAARLDLPGARATFEALLRDLPAFQPARLALARVAYAEGKAEEAEALLGATLASDPGNAEAAQQLAGIALSRAPRAAAARAVLVAAQAAAPDNLTLAATTARVLILSGEPARAVTLLEAAPLQVRGRGAEMPMLLAEARVTAGDLTGAEAASRTALAEDPRSVMVRRQLAILLARKGDLAGAEAILREGRITQPADPVLQATLVALVRQARGPDAALALAEQLARRPEARPASLTLRGDLLAAAGRHADAAQAFAEAYEQAPSSVLALRRAAMLGAAGRQADAVATLTQWLGREPEDLAALSMLSQFDLQAGRHADAVRRLETVVARRPGDAVALNNMAWALTAQGVEPERALTLAERAFFLAPSPASADTLGWVLVRQGRLDRGVALLRQATEASRTEQGPDPAMTYRLAFGLRALGQRQEATELLRPALARGTQFAERAEAERLMSDLAAGR